MRPYKYILVLIYSLFGEVAFTQVKIGISSPLGESITIKEGENQSIIISANSTSLSDIQVGFKFIGKNANSNTLDIETINPNGNILTINRGDFNSTLSYRMLMDYKTEASDTFIFELVTGTGYILDSQKLKLIVIVQDSIPTLLRPSIPYSRIGDIRGVNKGGVPDSINKRFTVRGIIYGRNRIKDGYQMSICDPTGCIGLYSNKFYDKYPAPLEGDSVEVSGFVNHVLGYGLINFGGSSDTIALQGFRSIAPPKVVTALDEASESQLVTLENLNLLDGTWTPNAKFSLRMRNNLGKIFTVYIENDSNRFSAITEIDNKGLYNITGIGGQYDASGGGSTISGYEILPRRMSDIRKVGSAPASIQSNKDISTTIYPNPVQNGLLNLRFPNRVNGIITLRIMNVIGEKLFEKTIEITQSEYKLIIPSEIQNTVGIYHLEILGTNSQEVKTFQILH